MFEASNIEGHLRHVRDTLRQLRREIAATAPGEFHRVSRQVAALAEQAGWEADEVSYAVARLAQMHIKARAANVETDAAIERARQRVAMNKARRR